MDTVKPERIRSFSLQAEIVRQIQANDGKIPCYATSASNQCDNEECGWWHDCFDETGEHEQK